MSTLSIVIFHQPSFIILASIIPTIFLLLLHPRAADNVSPCIVLVVPGKSGCIKWGGGLRVSTLSIGLFQQPSFIILASIISTIFLLLLHARAADNVSTSIVPVVSANLDASSRGVALRLVHYLLFSFNSHHLMY